MKKLVILIILNSTFSHSATLNYKNLFEVKFQKSKLSHTYELIRTNGETNRYELKFKDEKNRVMTLSLDEESALSLRTQALRLAMTASGRQLASLGKASCHVYANIKVNSESSHVCLEDRTMTGRAYGYLNHLHDLVEPRKR